MRSYRSLSAAVFAVVFCALLGGFYGRSALVAQDQIPEQYKVFTAALGAIETNFVGEVESDRLVYGAITGMLQTLDPHSSFMDPRSYAQMRERQEGRYYGLGISIQWSTAKSRFLIFEGSPPTRRATSSDVIDENRGPDTTGWTSAMREAAAGARGTPSGLIRRSDTRR